MGILEEEEDDLQTLLFELEELIDRQFVDCDLDFDRRISNLEEKQEVIIKFIMKKFRS